LNGGTQSWLRLNAWRADPRREALRTGVAILAGVVVVPALVWMVGNQLLGKYPNGGLLALWEDFFVGLAHGGVAYWLIAIGPYLFLWLLRAWMAVLRT
jgi:hypothetical protein